MLDGVEASHLLDILGNRNRRRIIQLLRYKPCFVTEISDRLVLSPKTVIEHLQMMEREEILISCYDERRRKYYYLSQDINVMINLEQVKTASFPPAVQDTASRFMNAVIMLRRMVRAREDLLSQLAHLEHDIEVKLNDIVRSGKEVLDDEHELDLLLALSHYDLTPEDLGAFSDMSGPELSRAINGLIRKGLVEQKGTHYTLGGNNGR